jgi:hypothetical protein
MTADLPQTMTDKPSNALNGRVTAPGDKSISHRALLLGAMAPAPVPTELLDLDLIEAQKEASAAQDRWLALRATSEKWASLRSARNTVAEMTRESETYKGMKKELEGVVAGLLKRVVDTFIARVQKHLPDGWKFGMMLEEAGKEVFRLGLLTNGKLRCALSGAEWATVTCALAMAICADIPADRPVLVMPEDRGWDAATLGKVLASWSGFEGQVVIGTPTKPKKVPTGWTVIELGQQAPKDLGHQCWPPINPARINLHQGGPGGDALPGRLGTINAAHADQGQIGAGAGPQPPQHRQGAGAQGHSTQATGFLRQAAAGLA